MSTTESEVGPRSRLYVRPQCVRKERLAAEAEADVQHGDRADVLARGALQQLAANRERLVVPTCLGVVLTRSGTTGCPPTLSVQHANAACRIMPTRDRLLSC
jgi:hypothetical protein